ncbi:hypothetical protein Gasu2_03160 [Galdieria sulphuraria]|nr:hypothetical protein Gasu2_03160 [Galdieria sulphuraria]
MSRAENKNNDQINAFASAKDEFLTEIDINIVSMKEEESPSTRRPEVTFMDCFEFLNQQKNNGREHFVNENGSGLEIPDRLFVSDVVSPKLLGYLTVQDLFSSPVDIKIISLLRNCDVVFRTSTSLETALKTYIRVADGEELIEKRLAITLFPTMLLGTGGDAGSQSSAIRGLATVKYNIGAHSGSLSKNYLLGF